MPTLFSVYDETDREEMIAFLKAVTEPLAEEFKRDGYVTFEQLCAEKTVEIDNSFFEESRRGKTREGAGTVDSTQSEQFVAGRRQ